MTIYYMGKAKKDEDWSRPTRKRETAPKPDGQKGRPKSVFMQSLFTQAKDLEVGGFFMVSVDPGSSICGRLTGMLPHMKFTQKKRGDLLQITRVE